MLALKLSFMWVPISLVLFIIWFGMDSTLKPWQAIVMFSPAIIAVISVAISDYRGFKK